MRVATAILALVVSVASATVCADERSAAITEERIAAVRFAMTMDLVTTSLASTCAQVDESAAAQAHTAWKARNWPLVDAAHQYLRFVSAQVESQRGNGAGQTFYQEQRAQFVSDADAALVGTFPGGDIGEAACASVIERLGSGAMDLEAKPEFFQSLVEIGEAISSIRSR